MPPATLVKPDPKSPTRRSLINLIIDWIAYLNSLFSSDSNGVINGGFEKYTASATIPDGWTFTAYPSGSGAKDTSTSADGLSSFKIVVPAGGGSNGGGYLETTDFITCSYLDDFYLKWKYKVDVATITNQVEIRWYDSAQAFISSSIIWSASSGQSTSWRTNTGKVLATSVPSNTRFCKIRLTGGSAGSVAGNVWYDEVAFFKPVIRNKYLFLAATTNFTVPENCTSITVYASAAGGGGGGATGAGTAGGAGGGGAFNEIQIDVIQDDVITIGIGTGGAGGTGGTPGQTGAQGGDTIIQKNTTTIYTIHGGGGGIRGSSGAAGGTGGAQVAYDGTNVILAYNGNNGTAGSGSTPGVGGAGVAALIGMTAKGAGGNGGSGVSGNGVAGIAGGAALFY